MNLVSIAKRTFQIAANSEAMFKELIHHYDANTGESVDASNTTPMKVIKRKHTETDEAFTHIISALKDNFANPPKIDDVFIIDDEQFTITDIDTDATETIYICRVVK